MKALTRQKETLSVGLNNPPVIRRFALRTFLTAVVLSLPLPSVAHANSASHEERNNANNTASAEVSPRLCKDVSLQVLGSGGPELDDGRSSSAYLIWINEKARVLIDAGSGSSVQFGASGAQFETLNAILLSHLHTDHAADLPSFIKGGYFTDRDTDLLVIGPDGNDVMPSTEDYIASLLGKEGAFRYLSSYTVKGKDDYAILPKSVNNAFLETPFDHKIDNEVSIEAIAVNHGPIPALAWKVNAKGCELVFSGDTNDEEGHLAKFAKNADLLVLHNAIDDSAPQAAKNLHMTPTQLIDIAKRSEAKRIVLSHFMQRSEPGIDALTEAMTVIAPGRVYAAQDLMNITLNE